MFITLFIYCIMDLGTLRLAITIIKLFFFFICCLHFDFALLNAHATSARSDMSKTFRKTYCFFCFTEVRHEWHAVDDCKEKQKDIHFQRIYNLHAHVKCLLQKSLTLLKVCLFASFCTSVHAITCSS